MTIDANIESAVNILNEAAGQSDEARSKTLAALRNLQLKLEGPDDTFNRLSYINLEITVSRIGHDLGIYKILVESSNPVSVEEFASKTGAAPLLTRRILRYLASVGQIEETSQDTFAANDLTKTLALPGYRAVVYTTFDVLGPTLQAFPDFLAANKYRDISDSANTPVQKAFDMDVPLFTWIPTQPDKFEAFQQVMAIQPRPTTQWYSVFPFLQVLGDYSGPYAFIDVGGGFGHQSVRLLEAFPQLRDRIILQDLPETLAHGNHLDGITSTPHSFFEAQPIKGARFYYMRNILHDWPDEKCITILSHLRDALEPGSSILIDDIVLPNVGVHWKAASLDLVMMSTLAALERTTDDWHALLKAAGLQILRVHTYVSQRQDSIIQAIAM